MSDQDKVVQRLHRKSKTNIKVRMLKYPKEYWFVFLKKYIIR